MSCYFSRDSDQWGSSVYVINLECSLTLIPTFDGTLSRQTARGYASRSFRYDLECRGESPFELNFLAQPLLILSDQDVDSLTGPNERHARRHKQGVRILAAKTNSGDPHAGGQSNSSSQLASSIPLQPFKTKCGIYHRGAIDLGD